MAAAQNAQHRAVPTREPLRTEETLEKPPLATNKCTPFLPRILTYAQSVAVGAASATVLPILLGQSVAPSAMATAGVGALLFARERMRGRQARRLPFALAHLCGLLSFAQQTGVLRCTRSAAFDLLFQAAVHAYAAGVFCAEETAALAGSPCVLSEAGLVGVVRTAAVHAAGRVPVLLLAASLLSGVTALLRWAAVRGAMTGAAGLAAATCVVVASASAAAVATLVDHLQTYNEAFLETRPAEESISAARAAIFRARHAIEALPVGHSGKGELNAVSAALRCELAEATAVVAAAEAAAAARDRALYVVVPQTQRGLVRRTQAFHMFAEVAARVAFARACFWLRLRFKRSVAALATGMRLLRGAAVRVNGFEVAEQHGAALMALVRRAERLREQVGWLLDVEPLARLLDTA